jgi:hypothetical protein
MRQGANPYSLIESGEVNAASEPSSAEWSSTKTGIGVAISSRASS